MSPRVTVLMAVYNGERFLCTAIESILNQKYRDFEFLIIDDASTDSTAQIIAGISDARVRVIRNVTNLGAGGARNVGLANARGEFVAILDADDIALPDRLEIQVSILNTYSNVVLVGSSVELIDPFDARLGILPVIQDPIVLRWELYFRNPIPHSSVMYRREPALAVGGYDVMLPPAEDYALWSNLATNHTLIQIPQVLTRYRLHDVSLTSEKPMALHRHAREIVRQNIYRLIRKNVSYQVAAFLNGDVLSGNDVKETYNILEESIIQFHKQHHIPSNQFLLFESVMSYLLRLARQDESQRFRILNLAWRYIARYAPLGIASPRVWLFVARIVTPQMMRKSLHHVYSK